MKVKPNLYHRRAHSGAKIDLVVDYEVMMIEIKDKFLSEEDLDLRNLIEEKLFNGQV